MKAKNEKCFDNVHFNYHDKPFQKNIRPSIEVLGLDTETFKSGECFMVSTSLGDTFKIEEFPACMFATKYRNKKYVVYNLKFDSGSILRNLPMEKITELWELDVVTHKHYRYRIIPYKELRIQKLSSTGKSVLASIVIWDVMGFFRGGLNKAAEKYLDSEKLELDVSKFTPEWVKQNWHIAAKYCEHDAKLAADLANLCIESFDAMKVKVFTMISPASISWDYFKVRCQPPRVNRYWLEYPDVLDYAMQSYNGGKFEMTARGTGKLYEYDIISAYPYEITQLIDIENAAVLNNSQYEENATYGFLLCTINIKVNIHSPTSITDKKQIIYPIGEIKRVITKAEYEFFKRHKCKVHIHNAWWIFCKSKRRPFEKEVLKLMKHKDRFKANGDIAMYNNTKLLLNTLYGKFVQLIDKKEYWKASINWNPIYGAIITANVRIRISELQQKHKSIIAVHTDSVISTKKLPYPKTGVLGDLIYETEGQGGIWMCGVYQIGDKIAQKGFIGVDNLMDFFKNKGATASIKMKRFDTWREVASRNNSKEYINKLQVVPKKMNINVDMKMLWMNDPTTFRDTFGHIEYGIKRLAIAGTL